VQALNKDPVMMLQTTPEKELNSQMLQRPDALKDIRFSCFNLRP
jgi:hypothetical protein